MNHRILPGLLLSFCVSCSSSDNNAPENSANSANSTMNGAPNNSASNNSAMTDGVSVTVGVFRLETDGSYTNLDKDLVFVTGVACGSWERTVMMPAATDTIQEPHQHFNAADDVSYENDTVTWTEYGPEHSESEIDTTCAAGQNGKTKSVNSMDYYFDGNMGEGFYLKITSVE